MICIRSCEPAFVMEESNEYRLVLLYNRTPALATGVLRRADGIYIITSDDVVPIYAFKMEKELMRLLKDNMEAWYE